MSNSVMRDKAKAFAKNIVFLCRNMKAEHKETVLINQLLLLLFMVLMKIIKESMLYSLNLIILMG